MKKLPKFLKDYFWDIDVKRMDVDQRHIYILKRILEYGDENAVDWMWKNFKKSEIEYALSNFRGYSQKSANYWSLILNVPKEKVQCLKERSSGALKTFWPY